jgi:DNA mismatch repair protein MutL
MIEILIDEYKNSESDPSLGALEKVAAGMAGASAIQYGKALTRREMEELFDTLFACNSPNYSPSGKPVINIIPIEDIEKKFK